MDEFQETTAAVNRFRQLMTQPTMFAAWEVIWIAFWAATFAMVFWKLVGLIVNAAFRLFL
jgi:hypothetical protein